jgi:uncharacterized protein YbbC (DUF1343 family)/CubicO group peptidase (beta-lactamase class C family)
MVIGIASVICALLVLFAPAAASGQSANRSPQSEVRDPGFDSRRLELIGPLVEEAIRDGRLPGAVVVAGRRDKVLYRRAFGQRAVTPVAEPMTLDTIFDVASLTKVVATTTAVMALVEDGKIRLNDRVSAYITGFERYGKDRITIRHLLTHVSGLRPDLDLGVSFDGGAQEAIRQAIEEVPVAPPNERLIYSDIGFFLLGHIVEVVSQQRLDQFLQSRVFGPLGMTETTFLPQPSLSARIAPTEACEPLAWPCGTPGASMLRGVVHDPTARRMLGVAGHAGLFSTGEDLATFARMILGGGSWNGARILAPLTVAKMSRPATPAAMRPVRGLGWDIDTPFSSNRGELLPVGSFGHTGFTGTSIWIDPVTETFVIFLSNRVHPDGSGDVTPLRARISTVVASAVTDVPVPLDASLTGTDFGAQGAAPQIAAPTPVLTGIDVLRAESFARLKGRKIGLVTNHTGRAGDGTPTIDLLHEHKDLTVVSLFSPEHGIRGILDEDVPSSRDQKTGLTIHSLYGKTRRPTDDMLAGIDTIVIDLQDIGVRFYTYGTTMAYVMEEAAKRQIRVVVLDRPNPISGWKIEGPALDEAARGFTGYIPSMPTRHGMTLGELARLFNEEAAIRCDLEVVAMKHWSRDQWFDDLGLEWINPSPNMRNLIQATLYPGIGSIEYGNISVGRGTDTPFEHIGAPWIDGRRLAAHLNARRIPGLRVYPTSFTPTSSKFAKERCQGVFFIVTDREALSAVRLGLEVVAALDAIHPGKFEPGRTGILVGSAADLERARTGTDPAVIAQSWAGAESRWRSLRAKYLLY